MSKCGYAHYKERELITFMDILENIDKFNLTLP